MGRIKQPITNDDTVGVCILIGLVFLSIFANHVKRRIKQPITNDDADNVCTLIGLLLLPIFATSNVSISIFISCLNIIISPISRKRTSHMQIKLQSIY